MTREDLKEVARIFANHEKTEEVFEAVVEQEKKSLLEAMRSEVRSGNATEAILTEGQIIGLTRFYSALKRFAK